MSESNIYVSNHPVVLDKLARLRENRTSGSEFRRLVSEITLLLGYEATQSLATMVREIETPLTAMQAEVLAVQPLLVPILRAGLGMVDAMLQLLPEASVGHIGLFRDHGTLEPVEYYVKLPKSLAGTRIFLLDPMLATGGSAAYAVELLEDRGADQISLISVVAAPEGVARMQAVCPQVNLVIGALDQKLDAKGYILPGLGDAGDRLYQTTHF